MSDLAGGVFDAAVFRRTTAAIDDEGARPRVAEAVPLVSSSCVFSSCPADPLEAAPATPALPSDEPFALVFPHPGTFAGEGSSVESPI